jgi:hypothetical protein
VLLNKIGGKSSSLGPLGSTLKPSNKLYRLLVVVFLKFIIIIYNVWHIARLNGLFILLYFRFYNIKVFIF